jgi:hypothetical protein
MGWGTMLAIVSVAAVTSRAFLVDRRLGPAASSLPALVLAAEAAATATAAVGASSNAESK